SMIGASLVLAPLAIATWPTEPVSWHAWSAAIAIALLCTGFAYIMFFRLIASVGPTGAVSVTFLVPVFGVLWGVLFLHETVTMRIIAGATVILIGTALTLGLIRWPSPRPVA